MATSRQTYSGDEIMLFKEDNTSFAWATNHSITFNLSTNEILTKDNPVYPIVYLSKVSNEITTENLYCEDVVTLFNYLITGEALTLRFGKRKDTNGQYPADGDIEHYELDGGTNYFQSRYILTSLEINANTGDKTTYSAMFQSVGKIEMLNDIKTLSTVDATQFESLQYGFFWKGWQSMSQHNPVSIGWDDDVMGQHSVEPNNVAYFVPNVNFNLYVYSQIPNTQKMEITFQFAQAFDEEADITLTYNGEVFPVHISIGGTPKYTLTLDGADETVRMESNSFPDVRVRVREIKIYYTE